MRCPCCFREHSKAVQRTALQDAGAIPFLPHRIWTFLVRCSSFKWLKKTNIERPTRNVERRSSRPPASRLRLAKLPLPAGEGRGEGGSKQPCGSFTNPSHNKPDGFANSVRSNEAVIQAHIIGQGVHGARADDMAAAAAVQFPRVGVPVVEITLVHR